MSVLYSIDKSTLDGIGNAIRSKKGTTEPIPVTSLADAIASIKSGSEESKEYTLRSGIWTSKGNTTGNYEDLPYPSYSLSADISGSINDLEFTRITISGYGLGMDSNNSIAGAPYPDIYFYNGDEQVAHYYGGDLGSSSGSFGGFVIYNETQVTATFCLAFRGLFQ